MMIPRMKQVEDHQALIAQLDDAFVALNTALQAVLDSKPVKEHYHPDEYGAALNTHYSFANHLEQMVKSYEGVLRNVHHQLEEAHE